MEMNTQFLQFFFVLYSQFYIGNVYFHIFFNSVVNFHFSTHLNISHHFDCFLLIEFVKHFVNSHSDDHVWLRRGQSGQNWIQFFFVAAFTSLKPRHFALVFFPHFAHAINFYCQFLRKNEKKKTSTNPFHLNAQRKKT